MSPKAKQIFSPTNMKIASPTKTLKMESAGDLNLRTAIGKLNIEALSTIHMEARNVRIFCIYIELNNSFNFCPLMISITIFGWI